MKPSYSFQVSCAVQSKVASSIPYGFSPCLQAFTALGTQGINMQYSEEYPEQIRWNISR